MTLGGFMFVYVSRLMAGSATLAESRQDPSCDGCMVTALQMLFLTVHTDWGGHHAAELRRTGGGPAQAPDADPRKGVHEKVAPRLHAVMMLWLYHHLRRLTV